MTSRTYLSIGDVLTLLREEFPDVTISKIRFLESQGLVNPERSPSGYRKFFETDVERLRWVLRQQREHFLPLKVIRDRLADGDLSEGGAEPAAQGARGNGRSSERAHAVAGAASGAGAAHVERGHAIGAGAGAGGGMGTGTATAPRTAEQSTQADDEAMARILADASRRAARVPESVSGHALLEAVPDPGAPPLPGPSEVLDVPRERDLPSTPDVEALRADPDAPVSEAATAVSPTVAGPTPTESPSHEVAATAEPDIAAEPAPVPAAAAAATPAPDPAPVAAAAAVPTASSHDVFSRAAAAVGTPSEAHDGASGVGRHAAGEERVAASAEAPAVTARAEAARPGSEKRAGAGAGAGGVTGVGRAAGAAGAAAKASGSGGDRGGAAGGTSGASSSAIVTGASLTTEELCAASGLSEIELAGLQGFGLIEPVMVAGIPTFDEDALTVANLAAEFRKFGIEARHLRPYRNAVDREMGLIEQVIIPLLRQRNPESRQRALDAADELGALGQTMRATLLRTAMRRHLGG